VRNLDISFSLGGTVAGKEKIHDDSVKREASSRQKVRARGFERTYISIDEASLKRNFEAQGDAVLAEAIYIALQMAGYEGDAHELVNHIAMPHSRQGGVSLLEATQWALQQQSATRCGVKSRRSRRGSTC
jgi:hypothetical protein